MGASISFVRGIRARAANRRSVLLRRYIGALARPVRIVDLGGTAEMWRRWGFHEADGLRVTVVNTHEIDKDHADDPVPERWIAQLGQDVMTLTPTFLQAHDVVFSNSMLEHLSTRADQQCLADIIMHSGCLFFIQVPNKYCPVDPHFPHPFAPFFAAMPRVLQATMLSLHPLGSGGRSRSYREALRRLGYYTPIGPRRLRSLFPQGTITVEWNMGLPMSLVTTRGPIAGVS